MQENKNGETMSAPITPNQSPSVNAFVRGAVESGQMPGRPAAVEQSMEQAFGKPIAEIDAMVLGRTASQTMIEGAALELAPTPTSSPLDRLKTVFQQGRAKLNEFGDATGINRLLVEDRGEVSSRTVAVVGGAVLALLIVGAVGQQLQRDNNSQSFVEYSNDKSDAQEAITKGNIVAGTTYSPEEELIGTGVIGIDGNSTTEIVDNIVERTSPNVDPSNIDFSGRSAQESGLAQGIVQTGDTFDVVLEDTNGDGKKEVVIQPGDLNPAELFPPALPLESAKANFYDTNDVKFYNPETAVGTNTIPSPILNDGSQDTIPAPNTH